MHQDHTRPEEALPTVALEDQRIKFANQIQDVCKNYGVFGNVILYRPSPLEGSRRNKMYLIAGRDPSIASENLPEDFNPADYLHRNLRNERLFYTDVFIHELSSDSNRMMAMEQLIEYCKYTEFLSALYARYRMEPPLKLRRFEIRQLMDARTKQRRVQMDGVWRNATEALNDYFEHEKKTGIQKDWLDFFRSNKYPDDAGPFERLNAFRNRNHPEVSMKQLMSCSDRIQTLEMQEHEYSRFSKIIQSNYPGISYAVSKKMMIDNGAEPTKQELEHEYGKRVTGEQYDRIRDERFAKESWSCIMDLIPSSFEIRKVSFASIDEPYIAAAFHEASLLYAQKDTLSTIQQRGGSLRLYAFPIEPREAFMNFVSLAFSNQLPFHLDTTGVLETPSLDRINVIYSSCDEELFFDILERIVNETVDIAHLIPDEERPGLQELLYKAEQLPKPKQGRGLTRGTTEERL